MMLPLSNITTIPSYQELVEENHRLRENLASYLLNSKKKIERILALENQRDCFIKNLLVAASTPKVNVSVVMDYMVEAARTIYDETVHAILYEVRPLTGRTLTWIKQSEGLNKMEGISTKEVLFIYKDTKIEETGKSLENLLSQQRYLSMKHGTVVADAFFLREPVVSIPPEGLEEKIEHVHYGHYDKSRWQHVDQRAAFPVINPLSQTVEFILVIDKDGNRLTNYDIRYVRDFVNLASFALAIKQIMAEDRHLLDYIQKGLHDLAGATQAVDQLGGFILDLLGQSFPNRTRISNYQQRLSWQLTRFQRLVHELRSGIVSYDLQPLDLDRFVRNYLKNINKEKKFIDLLSFEINLQAENNMILIDTFVFQMVLENIVKNSYETEKATQIYIVTKQESNSIKLTIYDNGGGMDDALYQGILERSRAVTTKSYGSGLGIQNILRSLRNMNCIVEAINLCNKGFGYEIFIPLANSQNNISKIIELKL